MHERLSLVTWNMAQPSKTQIQFLDLQGYYIVFLPKIWNKGQELQGYMGPNRLLGPIIGGTTPCIAIHCTCMYDCGTRPYADSRRRAYVLVLVLVLVLVHS